MYECSQCSLVLLVLLILAKKVVNFQVCIFLHNVDLFAVTNEQKRTAVMNDLY